MSKVRDFVDSTKWSIAAGTVIAIGIMAMVAVVPSDNPHIATTIALASSGLATLFATVKAEDAAKVSKQTKHIVDPDTDNEGKHTHG